MKKLIFLTALLLSGCAELTTKIIEVHETEYIVTMYEITENSGMCTFSKLEKKTQTDDSIHE